MAMDGANLNAGALPVSEPRPVDVRDIEDALTQLWVTGQAGGHATMQAYVLNLIVFAGSSMDPSEAQRVAATVGATPPLPDDHPANGRRQGDAPARLDFGAVRVPRRIRPFRLGAGDARSVR